MCVKDLFIYMLIECSLYSLLFARGETKQDKRWRRIVAGGWGSRKNKYMLPDIYEPTSVLKAFAQTLSKLMFLLSDHAQSPSSHPYTAMEVMSLLMSFTTSKRYTSHKFYRGNVQRKKLYSCKQKQKNAAYWVKNSLCVSDQGLKLYRKNVSFVQPVHWWLCSRKHGQDR